MTEALWSMLESLVESVLQLILVDSVGHRLHWTYLITFLSVAVVLFVVRRPSDTGLFEFLLPKSVYRNRSFYTDIKIYLVNGLLGTVINLGTIIVSGVIVADLVHESLTAITGVTGLALAPNDAVIILFTILFVILSDFGIFVVHYAHHKIPFLWNLHKTHHSAEVLTPLTAFRFHPLELVLTGLSVAITVGPLVGIYQFLFDNVFFQARPTLFAIAMFVWLLTANFRHSHIPLHYPAILSFWLVSPAMHHIHHSTRPAHFDKNFGFMFSIWDRITNTHLIPEKDENIEFGIDGKEEKRFQSLTACYLLPLKDCYTLSARAVKRFASRNHSDGSAP